MEDLAQVMDADSQERLVMVSNTDITTRLREFLENEARSCSMDPGCITPEYVFRMWGGQVPLNEIEEALLRIQGL